MLANQFMVTEVPSKVHGRAYVDWSKPRELPDIISLTEENMTLREQLKSKNEENVALREELTLKNEQIKNCNHIAPIYRFMR